MNETCSKSIHRPTFALAAALLLFALSPPCLAAVYKCTSPDGKVTDSDAPCAADQKLQPVTMPPIAIIPAPAVSSPPTTVSAPPGTQPSPATRSREIGAQSCTIKAFDEWQKAQAPNVPDPDDKAEKLSEIRNQCLRQFKLPEWTPVKRDAVVRCGHRGFREYIKAQGNVSPPLQVQIAKATEINDECKRTLGSSVTTDSAAIASPSPNTQTASAPPQPSPAPATPGVAAVTPGANKDPSAVLNALVDRLYAIGETSGNGAEMIAAEAKAADDVRHYLSSGSTDGLLAQEKDQSPLSAAAYLGYPNVVAALLTSNVVRVHINDADDNGLTPWIAANLSMRQSLWTCNPSIWNDPFKFVPMLVTQPYYQLNPIPPYAKTREVLEKAGAVPNSSKAKEFWLNLCKNQSAATRAKVQASTDLQKTVQEVGAADLTAKILELQKKAAQAQKK